MTDDFALNPERELCVRCGQVARGYATGPAGRLCRPNDLEQPDCWALDSWERTSRVLLEMFPEIGQGGGKGTK